MIITNVKMLPESNADFTRALGMLVKKEFVCYGSRSWRYLMVVEDKNITNYTANRLMGDVINPVNLTPVALTEGIALVNKLYVNQPRPGDHDSIPTVFYHPPNGKVGLIEVRACVKYPDINIYKTSFTPVRLSRSLTRLSAYTRLTPKNL